MRYGFLILVAGMLLSALTFCAQTDCENTVVVERTDEGHLLLVDGEPLMVKGMNWDYFPIGTNYEYSLWAQSDDFITEALAEEMSMLQSIGVNAIRQYTGIPAKWITYIYDEYGIFTMLNHSFGRYGLEVEGEWVERTDYGDPKHRAQLLNEVEELVREYQDTRGLLLYLIGNENNYGLFWEGAETEDIPMENEAAEEQALAMYRLMNEACLTMKSVSTCRPIAICNGDLQFIELIARECPDADIFGTNMYRGASFGDAFSVVKEMYRKPLLFTEFGGDAWNAVSNAEDQAAQVYYLVENWREIYQNAAGLGLNENSLGGFTFQFSDGWWKFGQTRNLSVHDTNASWANGGYKRDYREGQNNMNEEWFGICAKGPSNSEGLYPLYPRAAYYALKEVHEIEVYGEDLTAGEIDESFRGISLEDALRKAERIDLSENE
jgi:hypothetical protein